MIINNQEPIIYEGTNSNNKIDIGNFEEILDFHKSAHLKRLIKNLFHQLILNI